MKRSWILLVALLVLLAGPLPAAAAAPLPTAPTAGDPAPLDAWEAWRLRAAYRHTRSIALLGSIGFVAGPATVLAGVLQLQVCPLGCLQPNGQAAGIGLVALGSGWWLASVPLTIAGTLQGLRVLEQVHAPVRRGAVIAAIAFGSLGTAMWMLPSGATAAFGTVSWTVGAALGLAQLVHNDRWARRRLGWRSLDGNPPPEVLLAPVIAPRQRGVAVVVRL